MNQTRTPAGVPTGGQFAAAAHDEATVSLGEDPFAEERSDLERARRDAYDRDPDESDYEDAADSAVRCNGLGGIIDDIHYDTHAAEDRNSLGIVAHGWFSDIEGDYLHDSAQNKLTDVVESDPSRRIHMAAWTPRRDAGSVCDYHNRYVSVSLDDDEAAAATAQLEEEGEEFASDMVECWRHGDPARMDATFGYVNQQRQWQKVSNAVGATSPDTAGQALSLAERLRAEAAGEFGAVSESYIGTKQWRIDNRNAWEDASWADACTT